MRTIYKYPIAITDKQTMILPAGAEFLSVQAQNNDLYTWVLLDTEKPKESVNVRIYGTGHPIEDNIKLKHIETIQIDSFVWHVFIEVK